MANTDSEDRQPGPGGSAASGNNEGKKRPTLLQSVAPLVAISFFLIVGYGIRDKPDKLAEWRSELEATDLDPR